MSPQDIQRCFSASLLLCPLYVSFPFEGQNTLQLDLLVAGRCHFYKIQVWWEVHATETEISSGLMGHLAQMQTLPFFTSMLMYIFLSFVDVDDDYDEDGEQAEEGYHDLIDTSMK